MFGLTACNGALDAFQSCMKFVPAVLIAFVALYFVFRSGPIERERQHSVEVDQVVKAPERTARKNYLKSPIDRTQSVVRQVKASRADQDF